MGLISVLLAMFDRGSCSVAVLSLVGFSFSFGSLVLGMQYSADRRDVSALQMKVLPFHAERDPVPKRAPPVAPTALPIPHSEHTNNCIQYSCGCDVSASDDQGEASGDSAAADQAEAPGNQSDPVVGPHAGLSPTRVTPDRIAKLPVPVVVVRLGSNGPASISGSTANYMFSLTSSFQCKRVSETYENGFVGDYASAARR